MGRRAFYVSLAIAAAALGVACASGAGSGDSADAGAPGGDDAATGSFGDASGPPQQQDAGPAAHDGAPSPLDASGGGAHAGNSTDANGGAESGADAAAPPDAAADGGTTSDPFDPQSCAGPPLTEAQAAQFFQPGATQANIGSYTIEMRQRDCNAVTGCAPWGAPTTAIGTALGGGKQPLSGLVLLNVQGTSIVLALQDSTEEKPYSMGTTCSPVSGGTETCSAYAYDMGDQWGGSGGYFPTMADLTDVDSNDVTFTGVLTAQCLRLAYAAKDASGNDVQQFVLLAPVAPGPPLPPDPCPGGGTQMACGSQAAGQTTCCQKGLTTCPQSGCDCWAACQ